ncbi:hypothetical protein COP1_019785 [Malus domestica]
MLDILADDLVLEDSDVITPTDQPELHHMELSESAFYGTPHLQSLHTMKVAGLVNGHTVRILLDSGSTHNFGDGWLVKKLGWHMQGTKPFNVMIANGGRVRSQGYCKQVKMEVWGY